MNKKTLFKKILSFLLAIMLILPPVSEVSMAVINAAENATSNEKVYEHDGYTVVYKVVAQWEGHKAIEVTLKNTGTKSITNWVLSIDNTGDMTGLWNAVLSATDLNKHTVKCMDYNNTIQAGQSVTFGYTLKGTDLSAPDDISMCAVESVLSEGFDVAYKVTGDWGTGFQGEIKIVNESEVAIEGWKLNFRGNFDVLNYWNCELTENADGTYTITHTSWQNSIPSGGEYVIGFVGSKADDEMVISDVKMMVTGCGAGSGETETDPTSPSEPETSSIAPTEPTTETPTEPETSTAAPTEPTTPSETKPTETEPTTSEPEINWDDETDTDGDGLPDVYEINMFGTNPENEDTDGDRFSDGYEVYGLGTDPAKADTDDNGVTDDKEDFDNDGLDNYEEYLLGTNIFSADSDLDGLSDYSEINEYSTLPLDNDTDDDGIIDGDEIKLGLNPLSAMTDGVADNERIFEQSIASDDDCVEYFNTNCEGFDIALDIRCAGVASTNLSVDESLYENAIQNDFIVGDSVEIEYPDNLQFEGMTLKFDVEDGLVAGLTSELSAEFTGLNRYNVFKYQESENILLPVKSYVEDDMVMADVVETGVYCLVDMEKWLLYLEYEPSVEEPETIEENYAAAVFASVENEKTTAGELSEPVEFNELLDSVKAGSEEIQEIPMLMSARENSGSDSNGAEIYFILQGYGYDDQLFEFEKAAIKRYGQVVYELLPGTKIRVLLTRLNDYEVDTGWIDNYDEFAETLGLMTYEVSGAADSDMSRCLNRIMQEHDFAKTKPFIIWVMNGGVSFDSGYEYYSPEQLVDNYSVYPAMVGSVGYDEYGYNLVYAPVHDVTDDSAMVYIRNDVENLALDGAEHFYDIQYNLINPRDKICKANNLEKLPISFGRLSTLSTKDYDGDDLPNVEEIDYNENVVIGGRDIIKLPTLYEYITKYGEVDALDRYRDILGNDINKFLDTVKILPLVSDPMSIDGDGDGIPDNYCAKTDAVSTYKFTDPNKLKSDVRITVLKNDFFSVDYKYYEDKAEEDWIQYNYGKAESYGGNQSWMGIYGYTQEERVFCDNTVKGAYIQEYGCGIIAVADFFLYLTIGDAKYNPTAYAESNSSINFGTSYKNIDFDTYVNYVIFISNYFKLFNGLPAIGVFDFNLVNGLEDIIYDNDMGMRVEWLDYSDSEVCLKNMKDMIKENFPVIFKYYSSEEKNKKSLLLFEKGGYTASGHNVQKHWMVATGIIEYSSDVVNVIGYEKLIKIATYGKELYMNYNDFGENLDLHTNIFYIEG